MLKSRKFPSGCSQFNPAVGMAALVAALPPVLFWVRVYINSQKAIKDKEEEERIRKVRI